MMNFRCKILAAGLLLLWATATWAAVIEPGHSALWYDPARDGEGFVLEIQGDNRALLTWYTYDDDGNQRWLTGDGVIERDDDAGDYIDFPQLLVHHGGRFGADFDPGDVQTQVAGSASLAFVDCYHGVFAYDAFGQSGELAIHRLTHTMAAGCRPIHGMTGEPVFPHAGQSGIWYDPDHDGEGWYLQWMAHNEAIITWYTYDSEGNPLWLLGPGAVDDDGTLVFENLTGTFGARFGDAFDPADVKRFDWGRLELTMDCAGGSARYTSLLPEFGSGEYANLQRLGQMAAPAMCPWQAPKLTDLYDFTLTRFNIEDSEPFKPRIVVRELADDGTVLASGPIYPGSQQASLIRLRPGETVWEYLPIPSDDDSMRYPPWMAPDGSFIVSHIATYVEGEDFQFTNPMRWTDETGQWLPLPDMLPGDYRLSSVLGASPDRTRILGQSSRPSPVPDVWIWDAENGAVILPTSDEIRAVYPYRASDDGRIVAGATVNFPHGNHFARSAAIRWHDGAPPEYLLDAYGDRLGVVSAIDSNGRIIFGYDQVRIDDNHPNARQAWYWISPERQGYLGTLDNNQTNTYRPWSIVDASHDGSMAVGNFTTSGTESEGFIWTQDTGLTSLREVLEHAGLLEELERTGPWSERAATRTSSSGDLILLEGRSTDPQTDLIVSHGAILHLTPKVAAIDDP